MSGGVALLREAYEKYVIEAETNNRVKMANAHLLQQQLLQQQVNEVFFVVIISFHVVVF